ncbi:inositol monophosphatase family protein [Microbacterium aurantiacum]|uniref:inositol monophosphatase family protein n=1 Tax=Microbacterium aurantiacum TaxID=162393 RepID=UPI001F207E67|nr:inositol monophosphatase family protein [Microbacterium aurantiacum]
MASDRDLHDLALDIAREAGALALRRRTEGVAIAATKSALADIVTEADREVEALVRARLAAEAPRDGFLGEETGAEGGESGLTWVVDPIDGTVNYAYGMPQYAVSIAVVAGEPDPDRWEAVAAAVYAPAVDEMFHAVRHDGAYLDGARLRVAELTDAGGLIATGFGYDPSTHVGDLAAVGRVLPLARDLRRAGAASLDLSYVAAGRLDGYFERGLQPWDHAAGALIVREAGGRFGRGDADAAGRVLNVAAAPELYDRLFAAALQP